MNSVIASAPAKLILSGEHSVIQGKPALAVSLNMFANCSITPNLEKQFIKFNLPDLSYTDFKSISELKKIKFEIDNRYAEFSNNILNIKDVLQNSHDLVLYSVIYLLEEFGIKITGGLEVGINSDIPIGCGLGSSAAVIVSIIHAFNLFFNLGLDLARYLNFGKRLENLQHGISSGLDIFVSGYGGLIKYCNKKISSLPKTEFAMILVNTGKPFARTGQCVNEAMKVFANNQKLVEEFAEITLELERSVIKDDLLSIKTAIKRNHRLLIALGVVPPKVQNFIAELEDNNFAAKICGAGSCVGESAGVILVIGDHDIKDLVHKYHYEILNFEICNHGVEKL